MANECFEHGKSFIGLCTWCGKQLCSRCTARSSGRKLYCGKCSQQLSEYEAEKPKPVKVEPTFKHELDIPHSDDIFRLHDEPKVVTTAPKGPLESQLFKRALQSTERMPSVALKQSSFGWAHERKTPGSSEPAAQSAQSALGMFAERAKRLERK